MMPIFVFGSNLAGIHGAGAALAAIRMHGAKHGIGVGRWANSYAIPTKDCVLKPLGLRTIDLYVQQFIDYAQLVKVLDDSILFHITRIGCGFAGYKNEHIAPMFRHAPSNCYFDQQWSKYVQRPMSHYWGTFP